MFIEVTVLDPERKQLIILSSVKYFGKSSYGSYLAYIDGTFEQLRETIEEIKQKIKEATKQ